MIEGMDILLNVFIHFSFLGVLLIFLEDKTDPVVENLGIKYFSGVFVAWWLGFYILFFTLEETGRFPSLYLFSHYIIWVEEYGRAIINTVLAFLSSSLLTKIVGANIRKNSEQPKRQDRLKIPTLIKDKDVIRIISYKDTIRIISLGVFPVMFLSGFIYNLARGVKEPLKFTFNVVLDSVNYQFAFIMFVIALLWTLILYSQKQVKPLKNDKHTKIDEDKEPISKDEIEIELERIEQLFKRKVISEDERNIMRKKVLGI